MLAFLRDILINFPIKNALKEVMFSFFSFHRPEDLHRIRVEHMERQLANLTGLVQKALTQNPQVAQNYLATAPNQQYRTGK